MARKPQQARSRATYDAIVEAGLILLAKEGVKGTSTRRIAELAGISVGSLYEYFENRDAVHQAMFERMISDTVAMVKPLVPSLVRMPLRDLVYELLRQGRQLLERDQGRYLHCVRHGVNLSSNYPLRPLQQLLTEMMMQYVMHHPELMRVPNLQALVYTYVYGGIAVVIRHLSEPTPTVSFENLARGLADIVANSMVPVPPDRKT